MAAELDAGVLARRGAASASAIRRPVLVGVASGALLLLVYAGTITVLQGWAHALDQTSGLWYWIALLAAGFGVQAGLFAFVRQELRKRQRAATASVSVSGGVSAGSMVACCAHHLTDVLPALGLAGLSAFLAGYQVPFIVMGVLSNLVGITMMLATIQRHNLSRRLAGIRWDLGRMKKWVMLSSGVVLAVVFLSAFLTR